MNRIEKNGEFYCEITNYHKGGIAEKQEVNQMGQSEAIEIMINRGFQIKVEKEIEVGYNAIIEEISYEILDVEEILPLLYDIIGFGCEPVD